MSRLALLLLVLSYWVAPQALASDPCMRLPATAAQSADVAERIAAAACGEHRLWYRPLIDLDGRIGGIGVREAERTRLVNDQPAWRRVIDYWRESGLLWQAGAGECAVESQAPPYCRSFVIDTPWSAAFVSWVMRQADLPGFNGAANHLAYVRRAYREPFLSAYRVANPAAAQVRTGDMLCSVRSSRRVYGFGELATLLSGDDPGLGMHCDVVVGMGIDAQRVRSAYLVGGNVLDSVTMRRLRLTPGDRFDSLPMRQASDPDCTPESPQVCDLNRQDWSVLLQLRPSEELAALRPAVPVPLQVPQGVMPLQSPPAAVPAGTPLPGGGVTPPAQNPGATPTGSPDRVEPADAP